MQEYYTLIAESEPDYDAILDIFVQLVKLRNRDAELAGYDSYAAYAYENTYAKDYSPDDSENVWRGVKEYFVPIMQKYGPDILDASQELYYSDSLNCSPDSVLNALATVLPQLSSELNTAYDFMIDHGLYDISQSATKSNTGFTTLFYYYNEPFIFNSASGTYMDYSDMFHEFGHFANNFYNCSDLLFGMSDNDLSELQSQGMEILFTFYYDELFGAEIGNIMRDDLLLDMVFSVVDGALYDEFQQRVYSEPSLTGDRVLEIFIELYEEYGYNPYEGYEYEWMGISHNFEYPFYYISYSVSALGALEIYDLCCEDWDTGLSTYLTCEAMDTEAYYYSEALSDAGFSNIFENSTYADIADSLAFSLKN